MTLIRYASLFNKILAIVKWILISFTYKKFNPYNFGYKIKIIGKNKQVIGRSNKFYGTRLDASSEKTSCISIGNNNIFYENTVVAGNGGNITIGNDNILSTNVFLSGHMGSLKLNDNIFVGPNVIIQGFGGVIINSGVMIGANAFISSSNHDFSNPCSDNYLLDEIGGLVVIGKKVWIGAGVIVTAGIKIGDCSVIGAGSVVTRDIPSYSIAIGSPAKVVRNFNTDSNAWEDIKSK